MDIQKEREAFESTLKQIGKVDDSNFTVADDGSYEWDSIHFAWTIWQAAKAQAVPECTWMKNEDGYFDASCGQSFVFSEPEDKPSSHEFTHCCFCGGKLIEAQEPANE